MSSCLLSKLSDKQLGHLLLCLLLRRHHYTRDSELQVEMQDVVCMSVSILEGEGWTTSLLMDCHFRISDECLAHKSMLETTISRRIKKKQSSHVWMDHTWELRHPVNGTMLSFLLIIIIGAILHGKDLQSLSKSCAQGFSLGSLMSFITFHLYFSVEEKEIILCQ